MVTRGKYIVIEGSDGIGKTTQTKELLVPRLIEHGVAARYLHEPGGTAMGEEIERLVKARTLERTSMTDLLLFTAARVEAWERVIKPALDNGEWIVADRNWLSSLIYQGYAGGLGAETVYGVTQKALPEHYIFPDMTILAHASAEQQLALLTSRGKSAEDYFESKNSDFQKALVAGYKNLGIEEFLQQKTRLFTRVSFNGSREEVHARVWQAISSQSTLLPSVA